MAIELEIVTPAGVALKESVDEVIAPSIQGEFGVLPGHLPLLAALDIGLLHYKNGDKTIDVAVGAGFAEIINDKALVLTDRFMTKAQISQGERVLDVRERLKEVDDKLDTWSGDLDDPERLALIDEERWLATQLELYGDPPQHKVLGEGGTLDYRDILPDDVATTPAGGTYEDATADHDEPTDH